MRSRFVACLFVVLFSGLAAAAEDKPWTLPRAEANRWADRLRRLTRDGWTVSVRGNDLVVQREKPVRFARVEVNAPPSEGPARPPADLREGTYRLTLRFGPRMSYDEYEKLAAENDASTRERERLQRKVDLPHKFDDFIATTPEEKARLRAYREAVAKLPWHQLPDLYTPDHSVYLYVSHDGWSYVYDKEAAAECNDVRESLLRYFGMYNAEAAAHRQEVGQPEPAGER